MRQTTTAEVRHDEGKATSFIRHEAGTLRFRCLRHPSRLGLLPWTLKTKQWRSRVRQSEEYFLLSVNYLTPLNRFLNDIAGKSADRGVHLANAGLRRRGDPFCRTQRRFRNPRSSLGEEL